MRKSMAVLALLLSSCAPRIFLECPASMFSGKHILVFANEQNGSLFTGIETALRRVGAKPVATRQGTWGSEQLPFHEYVLEATVGSDGRVVSVDEHIVKVLGRVVVANGRGTAFIYDPYAYSSGYYIRPDTGRGYATRNDALLAAATSATEQALGCRRVQR